MEWPEKKTLAWYKSLGYGGYNVTSRRTRNITDDFLGFADLIVWNHDGDIAIQATDSTHHATRAKKVLAAPGTREWFKNPKHVVYVVSWKSLDAKTPRIQEIKLCDLVKETV